MAGAGVFLKWSRVYTKVTLDGKFLKAIFYFEIHLVIVF